MISENINTRKHRIQLGRYSEIEDENGDLKQNFKPIKDVWAEITPMPLSSYFRGQTTHESNINNKKNVYKIKIRKNVIAKGRHETINAILWKYKILTNFYNLRPDVNDLFLEGIFCEQGSGVN